MLTTTPVIMCNKISIWTFIYYHRNIKLETRMDGCVKVRATKPSGFDLHRAGLSGKKHKKLLIILVFVKYLEVYR